MQVLDRLRRAYSRDNGAEREADVDDLKLMGQLSVLTDRLETAVVELENEALAGDADE